MDALAYSWPLGPTQICISPNEPSRTDTVQAQGGRGAGYLGSAILGKSYFVSQTNVPRNSPSLANSSEEGSPFSKRGHPLAPVPRGSRWATSSGS